MNIHIFASVDALAHAAADRIESAISGSPDLTLGLAGGSTPRVVHQTVARRAIDWTHVTAWMTDERWVPPTHVDSNQLMARTTLTEATGVHLLAPDTTAKDPAASATAFEDALIEHDVGRGRPAAAMLGMGDDGHTASLFPGTRALTTRNRSYVDNWVPAHDAWRLTATFEMLARMDRIWFLVAGAAKAEVVAQIADGASFPASQVTASEDVEWLLDADAASML